MLNFGAEKFVCHGGRDVIVVSTGETENILEFKIKSAKDVGTFQCEVQCAKTDAKTHTKPIRLDVKLPPKGSEPHKGEASFSLDASRGMCCVSARLCASSQHVLKACGIKRAALS